jgi:hypothetical protein
MISKERIEELEDCFWNESNDEYTQEWRDDLNAEEEQIVSEWDQNYNSAFTSMCKEILKHSKKEII